MADNMELTRSAPPKASGAARGIGRFANAVQLMLRPPLSEAALAARLNGKRVAIVGNALSLSDKTHGGAIDAHDIVIRFNGVRIPSTASHGARTDWVATAIAFDPALVSEHGVKAILWMTPKRKNLPPWMVARQGCDLYLHARERNADLAARLGAPRPSTGAMVIDLVMRSACAQASLYGFDFFASQSLSGAHTAASAPHDFAKERSFVHALAARDPRLVLTQ